VGKISICIVNMIFFKNFNFSRDNKKLKHSSGSYLRPSNPPFDYLKHFFRETVPLTMKSEIIFCDFSSNLSGAHYYHFLSPVPLIMLNIQMNCHSPEICQSRSLFSQIDSLHSKGFGTITLINILFRI
jgi:hypothetical protein